MKATMSGQRKFTKASVLALVHLSWVAMLVSGCPQDKAASTTTENSRSGASSGGVAPVAVSQPGKSGSGGGGSTVVVKDSVKETPKQIHTPQGADLNVYSHKISPLLDEGQAMPALEVTVTAVASPQVATASSSEGAVPSSTAEAGVAAEAAVSSPAAEAPFAEAPVADAPAAEAPASEAAVAQQAEVEAAPVVVEFAALPTVDLLPNTVYVLEFKEPQALPTDLPVETVSIVTLAAEPVVEAVSVPEAGKLSVVIDSQENPETTQVSVAVVNVDTGAVLTYVDVDTGKPVKEEERWDDLPVSADDQAADTTLLLSDLGFDPETVAIIVQAKNSEGVETAWSDPVAVTSVSADVADELDSDLWHDENLDVELDAVLGEAATVAGGDVTIGDRLPSLKDGIKTLKAQDQDLTNELKKLRAALKAAKKDASELAKAVRTLEKSKKSSADALAKANAAYARAEAEVDSITKSLQQVKARRLALRDGLKTKTAELKALLAERRAAVAKSKVAKKD